MKNSIISAVLGVLLGIVMVTACVEITRCSRQHTQVAP
jgi:hypothetical protein